MDPLKLDDTSQGAASDGKREKKRKSKTIRQHEARVLNDSLEDQKQVAAAAALIEARKVFQEMEKQQNLKEARTEWEEEQRSKQSKEDAQRVEVEQRLQARVAQRQRYEEQV